MNRQRLTANTNHHAQTAKSVGCACVTVSDTRTVDSDVSGRLMRSLLSGAGHRVIVQEIVRDDFRKVRDLVTELCARTDIQAVILTGGTGLSLRDQTYEAVESLLERTIDGFGELFRMLSYEQVGANAMLSRAIGGVSNRTAVFALPGSPKAVGLGLEKLILPTLGHVVHLVSPRTRTPRPNSS